MRLNTKWVVFLVLLLPAGRALAALGQDESSIALDRQSLNGADRQEGRQGYKLHQITAPDGSLIKEFVAPSGLVFGVAWQTPRMPNLQQLLGSGMTELQVALQSRTHRPGRAPLIVHTDKLIFVSGGHMRSYHGYAYMPGLVPSGVSGETVQ